MTTKNDAFGHIVTEEQNAIGVDGGKGLLDQYTLELETKTGRAIPTLGDPISIPELVKSYEDQCGMEWAKRMLRSGQIDPLMLADDGRHGGDYSGTTSLNVAYRQAQAAKAQGDKVANALGISGDYSKEDIDALVKKQVAEILASQQAIAKEAE